MIFNLISVCTIAGAILHLFSQPSHLRTKKRIVEISLLYLLSIQWGIGAVFSSIPHIVIPDTVADYIGWHRGSPFQIELRFSMTLGSVNDATKSRSTLDWV
ncbi:hypothetical protein L0222_31545 [bacterium]|nr:hypothetical protein [bacterium]